MVFPVTRSQAAITDARMRELAGADPDAPLKAARAQRRAAERAAATAGLPRLDRLPQEIHDGIAVLLPPRQQVDLASMNRHLHRAYQPHAVNSRMLAPLVATLPVPVPPLFDRGGNASDEHIADRLRLFLGPPAQPGDEAPPHHISRLDAHYRTEALIGVLNHSVGHDARLHDTALMLTRPHVEALSREHRGRVLDFMAERIRNMPGFAPDMRWCLDLVERQGARTHATALARMAKLVRDCFSDDAECTQTLRRFEAIARQLDDQRGPEGHVVRQSLASTWYRMPDAMETLDRLLASTTGRPTAERTGLLVTLARSLQDVARAALHSPDGEGMPPEQQAAVRARLYGEAATLPAASRTSIINAAQE